MLARLACVERTNRLTIPLSGQNAGEPTLSIVSSLAEKLEEPLTELIAHFVVTVCALVFIALTDFLLHLLHIDERLVPLTGITLSSWMFAMDVLTVSLVLTVGLLKA